MKKHVSYENFSRIGWGYLIDGTSDDAYKNFYGEQHRQAHLGRDERHGQGEARHGGSNVSQPLLPTYSCDVAQAGDWIKQQPDDSADLIFFSPPYTDARTYGIKADLNSAAWVEWMRPIVRECCRVSRGLVFVNCSDRVERHRYQCGPEWLFADLTRLDKLDAIRPYVWVKSGPEFDDLPNGTPGSGATHYHRNDYEPIYGYALPRKLPPPWSDPLAFGNRKHLRPGGLATQRNKDGERTVTVATARGKNGARRRLRFERSEVSNPGNVIRARVGGGNLGYKRAHEGEAPMALAVAERFVCWYCPPGGTVLDPFCGTGTTGHACVMHGRNFAGCDIRPSQRKLTLERLGTITPPLFT